MDNEKSKRITKIIKVYGIVQGVGFRPLVYRIAKKYGIYGTVRNVGGYVEILASAMPQQLDEFVRGLKAGNRKDYEIVKMEMEEASEYKGQEFAILHSKDSGFVSIIPPDLPVCPQCQQELMDPTNRRYQNPFISCMVCGPRYTILDEVPYDRDHTTMQDFLMCPDCQEEYTSPEHRRYHAQTISCNECGPYLIYRDNRAASGSKVHEASLITTALPDTNQCLRSLEKEKHRVVSLGKEKSAAEYFQKEPLSEVDVTDKKALETACSILQAGGIIAVKGIGGYHLACTVSCEETVQRLRMLKGREEKPFAVMFGSIEHIREYCCVSEEEEALLETRARPIVLLYLHEASMAPSIYKGSIYCGAFLAYTPLQYLLLQACGPLVMTSANFSGNPIIRDDEKMLSLQSPYLDGILYHKRRIVRSVDDSVAKVIDGKPQLIRRSRGYVPYPVFLSGKAEGVFAAGGDLKASFCLYSRGSAVVSQYFGDLEEESVMEEYQRSFEDLKRLFKITPDLAVCDLHPNYYSTQLAKSLGMPVLQVQHHHAHIASVIAEHDLKGKIIGVAFDGTGYGADGKVWGGEFLVCENESFTRAAHLNYTPMLGGDESMKDAKKTATCYLIHSDLEEFVQDERKAIIKAALKTGINTVLTSSAGRLFDAAAAILGICDYNQYEGECAAFLEREAVLALREGVNAENLSFTRSEENEMIVIDPKQILKQMCHLKGTVSTGALALGFHFAVADAIANICEELRTRYGTNTVALSGGVFQNTVLTEQTLKLLRGKHFGVYMNLAVPPGDGGISLGQTYLGLCHLKNDKDNS